VIYEQVEVYRQDHAVFVDRVWVREDGEACRSDRLFVGHSDQWEEVYSLLTISPCGKNCAGDIGGCG
jgi:hypothetical protein